MRAVWICTLLIAGTQVKPIASAVPADGQNAQKAPAATTEKTVSHRSKAPRIAHPAARTTQAGTATRLAQFLSMPLDFESNQGQAPKEYEFVAHGPSYALGISASGLALSLHRPGADDNSPAQHKAGIGAPEPVKSSNLRLNLIGTAGGAQVTGLDPQPGRSNYFIGNDPAKWRTDVAHFQRVRVAEAYPGIDLVFHGNHQQLEYDFDVAPGADPGRIRLRAEGADSVILDAAGNAILRTAVGDVELKHPVAYQQVAGVPQPVDSGFKLVAGDALEFKVGPYDHKRALTIDPVLDYAVEFGGSNGTFGMGLVVDGSGNTYISGGTCSADFPTTAGNFQQFPSTPSLISSNDCYTSYVTKMDPTGSTLLYSDFIGGTNGSSGASHLAIDSSGDVYLGGVTNATDFPTISNIGTSAPTSCPVASKGQLCLVGYILKLNPAGSQIMFSSLLGGSDASGVYQVKLNPVSGDLDVLGDTDSPNFQPAATTLETSFGGGTCGGAPCFNGFLLGLNPSTGALRYGTFIGGAGNDWAVGLAFDTSGNIYVAGSTQPPLSSALGTVTETYAPAGGATAAGTNLFVTKFTLSGTTLTPGYLTLIQGDADTGPAAIALDTSGYLYFAGGTAAKHLPVTSGVFQSANNGTGGGDCFWGSVTSPFLPNACGTAIVGKLNPSGALSFLTYLGGSNQDAGQAIGVDSLGNLWIGGVTSSTDFPFAANHYIIPGGLFAPFLAEMSNDGTELLDATPIGGPSAQVGDLQIDSSNDVYVTGFASAAPSTPRTYPPDPTVYEPAFVQKWTAGTPPMLSFSATSLLFNTTAIGAADTPQTVTIQNTGTTAAQLGIQLSSGYSESPLSDFLESTTCGTTLAASSSCTITVTFAPGPPLASCVLPDCGPTSRGAEILITDNAVQGDQTISLSGTSSVGASVTISPNPIVFPAQAAGTSSTPLYVSLEATGDTPFAASSIALSGPNATDFQLTLTGVGGNNCTSLFPPGSLCALDVTFSPPAAATGTRTATLTFTDNAADSPQSVTVTGTVAGSYALNLSPSTVSPTFPVAFGTSSYGELSFENPSTTNTVEVTSLSISGTNAGDFSVTSIDCSTAGALPMTVAPGATCYADITFNPAAGASGLRTATLTVGTSPAISGLPTIALQGDAVTNSQPGMSFFQIPSPMNFGGLQVGQTSNNESVLFTITNNAPIPCTGGGFNCGAPLIVNSITPGLGDYTVSATVFGSTTCAPFPVTIPTGENCDFEVTFTPAAAGPRNTTLTIQSNDPQGTVQLPVYGTGLTVPLGEFLQTALNFGNSAIGVASPPMTTTLQNTGESALNISAVSASGDFNVSANTCTGSLAPQATCTISITFTPPTAGFSTGMLTVTDNDAFVGQQVVNLTGTGATGPQLRITPETITFPNQALDTLSAPLAITFTSTGDSTVTFPANPIATSLDFILQSTTCSGSLPQGSSCTANVQFKPTNAALAGFPESGTMLVTDSAQGSPQPIYMQGTGEQGTTVTSTTTIVSSLNPSNAGQSVMFTATVTGPSGNTTVPTGIVTFFDGSTPVGSGNLNASGQAVFSTSTLSVGSHFISASYGGDSNFSSSTSSVLTQVVNGVALPATTTSLISSANPSATGQSITFTATVTGPSGNMTVPTGTVNFLDGTTTLASAGLNGSGVAVYSTSSLAIGSHSITAVYSGDTNFSGSTSTVLTQVVNSSTLLATTTAVTSSLNPSASGQSVTFTATVSGPSGNSTVPTGMVTFIDGTSTLGTGSLNNSAQATLSTSTLSAGSHSITAVYGGNTIFAGSTSTILTQTVGSPGFAVSFSPASVTINPGQSGTTTITVTPQNGFSQQVSFACSGLPAASTCSFSPSTVTPNGTAASTSTLTIATDVAMTPLHAPSPFGRHGSVERETLLAVVLFGLFGLVGARRRWKNLFSAIVLLAGLGLVVSGCGGKGSSSGSGGNSSTTPAGTSTVTVTATAGSVSQSGTFTLVVQ
jgi:hypothetical protein